MCVVSTLNVKKETSVTHCHLDIFYCSLQPLPPPQLQCNFFLGFWLQQLKPMEKNYSKEGYNKGEIVGFSRHPKKALILSAKHKKTKRMRGLTRSWSSRTTFLVKIFLIMPPCRQAQLGWGKGVPSPSLQD